MTLQTVKTGMNSDHLVEQFIHSCSHDLRSPLTSIKGLVKVAAYYPQSTEVYNCFRMIDNCTEMMDKLIRALEEFMVINHYNISPEAINYDVLLDGIIERFTDEIESKTIVVNKKINTVNTVVTDQFIFTLIFKHIFKNAISFHDASKKDKYVDIQIDSEDNFLKLTLKDNGVGIPSRYHQKIFRPFFKASTQSKGQGMGLFLLTNLLNKVNASISLQSKEKQGTTIVVLIPNIN
jgi:signal transduction histidine kinase